MSGPGDRHQPVSLEVDAGITLGSFALDVVFQAGPGVTALSGPSGAGKSTIVALVAGLLRPERGHITLGQAVLADAAARCFVPPHRRRLGVVFQEPRLFPHLSVRQNLLFGRWLRPRGVAAPPLGPVVALLGLEGLLHRRPHHLSGGEAQRVAIGRALLSAPRMLLMDEPLASLDAARRAEILPWLERLARAEGPAAVPILYVSHAEEEVARLADRVVRIQQGRVVAAGPVATMLGQLRMVDGGTLSLLTGRLEVAAGAPQAAVTLAHPAGRLVLPDGLPARAAATGDGRLRVLVAARDVALARPPLGAISIRNRLCGHVTGLHGLGDGRVRVDLDCGGEALAALLTADAVAELELGPGVQVVALIKATALG